MVKSSDPLCGNATNRVLSGVLVPLLLPLPDDGGDNAPCDLALCFGIASVVARLACVVSAEGGGGKFARRSGIDERTCERQRKHSRLPYHWDTPGF